MAWTSAQKKVIETRDKNILVSAAAGSGKTAVLVERIIQRVLDQEHPIDIDKIMVVTFTNAAAGEMRERVLKAIEEELAVNPDNAHLQKQQAYIHNAYITTMHSFCLNLVREHFNDIDLDPAVRVADAGEIELLKSDTVKEVLEEYYSSKEPEEKENFFRFVSQFEGKTGDEEIESMVLSLYHTAMGYPYPKEWLLQCVKKYEYADVEELKHSPYISLLNRYAGGVLSEMLKSYDTMLSLCENGGPDKYIPILEEERSGIAEILNEQDYDKRRVKLNRQFLTLPRCKKEECDPDIKDMVTGIRNKVKENFQKLRDRTYHQSIEEGLKEIKKCHDIIKTYTEVTCRFIDRFQAKKKEKNILDFDDFEHYAIDILTTGENGEHIPSKTADEIAGDFEEIMVDEYQDSNMVQETILSALCRERFGGHNRFMVGDVKQSIYGFRGANPDIFVEKYHTYSAGEESSDYKIILDKNFRSRKGVIDTTNFLFYQVMNSELGGIDYDEENRLNPGLVPEEPAPEMAERIDDRTELLLINTKENIGDREDILKEAGKVMDTQEPKETPRVNDTEQNEEEEELSVTALEAEAKVIAHRICELTDIKTGMVIYDKNEKKYRTLRYSDIVILLRSIGQNADCISEELMKVGIPVYMESRTGYFKTSEISTIVNYLKIIDNPMLDIPMAAVLKSPIVGISDENLAVLRAVGGKNISLYEDIEVYLQLAEQKLKSPQMDGREEEEIIGTSQMDQELWEKMCDIAPDEKLVKHLKAFMAQLTGFRDKVIYLSIYQLVSELIEATGYYDYVSAMPAGEKRIANIEMLKTKAADYEKGSYKGLFNFIRYIDKMNKYNVDLGEASIANENDNTVRIMTIHKSKGLEFPVVFIANIHKRFNFMDAQSKCVIHAKLGIGIDHIDEQSRIIHKNIIKAAINRQIRLEVIEEELRLFYVACTRARDKVIFSGSGVDKNRMMKMISHQSNQEEYLGYGVVSQFVSYMDFITIPLARNKAFEKIYTEILMLEPPAGNRLYQRSGNIGVRYLRLDDIFENVIEEKYVEGVSADTVRKLSTEQVYSQTAEDKLKQILLFDYPYRKQTETHAKMSVSEIKKESFMHPSEDYLNGEAMQIDFMKPYIDSREEKSDSSFLSGAERGTVYHTVFEKFDYDREPTYRQLEEMIAALQEKGILTEEERKAVRINDFLTFTKTKLYGRMRAAYKRGELYREVQFVAGFYESEIEEFKRMAQMIGKTGERITIDNIEKNGDMVLIQGIIDAYFVENGRIIIVDYKTDNIKDGEELIRHYAIQLELYRKAVEQILQLPVAEKILYSTKLGRELSLSAVEE